MINSSIGIDFEGNVNITIGIDEYETKIPLKNLIFNAEMDINDYYIVFHKHPSKRNFKKFCKTISEHFEIYLQSNYIHSGLMRYNGKNYVHDLFFYFDNVKKFIKSNEDNLLCWYINDKLIYNSIIQITRTENKGSVKVILWNLYNRYDITYENMALNNDRFKFVNFENIEFKERRIKNAHNK